jgi:hypothetical protein
MKDGNLTILYTKETRLSRTMCGIREMCDGRASRQCRDLRACSCVCLQYARRASGHTSRDRSRMPSHLI